MSKFHVQQRAAIKKLILVTLVLLPTTTNATTCIHEDDYSKCSPSSFSNFPCNLIVHRIGDVPTALFCDNTECFKLVSSKKLSEETKKCFSLISVANFSHCSGCFDPSVERPFEDFLMSKIAENNILDLSHNSIDSSYVDNNELLYGPLSNLDILYLSHNALTSFPETTEAGIREMWLDNNKIESLELRAGIEPMTHMEFLTFRDNPLSRVTWRDFSNWPETFPNLQVLDVGKNKEDDKPFADSWFLYPILSRFEHLRKIYWPHSTLKCTCPMMGAFGRYMQSDFSIVTGKLKQYPHEDTDPDGYGVNLKQYSSTDRYARYVGYYLDETPVMCSEESERDLIGQSLEKFSSVVKKYCSGISLEREEEEEPEEEQLEEV